MKARRSFAVVLLSLVCLLTGAITLSVMVGPVELRPGVIWRVAFDRVAPGVIQRDWEEFEANIVWEIRFPRVLLAAVVGAGLAVVGAAMQATVRNPLADPYLLGTSSGAALGAVTVILFWGDAWYVVAMAAFLGAMGASVLVYALAADGRRLTTTRLVLSGVAASSFFSAITNVLIFRQPSGEQTRSALFWLLGGLGAARWSVLGLPAVTMIAGTLFLIAHSRTLNVLSIGEEASASLGVEGDRVRRWGFVLASLVAGVLVAVSGGIGFVGLMTPHIGRFLVGSEHRRLLPVVALGGASFLVLADIAARTVAAPQEIPIGIITAMVGTPFFVWLMRRRSSRTT